MGQKTLCQGLGRRGNPAVHNVLAVSEAICEDLGIKPREAVTTA